MMSAKLVKSINKIKFFNFSLNSCCNLLSKLQHEFKEKLKNLILILKQYDFDSFGWVKMI